MHGGEKRAQKHDAGSKAMQTSIVGASEGGGLRRQGRGKKCAH